MRDNPGHQLIKLYHKYNRMITLSNCYNIVIEMLSIFNQKFGQKIESVVYCYN